MSSQNLIAPDVQAGVNQIISIKTNSSTVSDQITDLVSNFYNDYIEKYVLLVAIVLVITVVLISKYYDKYEEDKNNKYENKNKNKDSLQYTEAELKIMKDILFDQTPSSNPNYNYNEQPTMDRLRSVNSQQAYVNYPPSPIPLNIPGQGVQYPSTNSYPQQYPNLNNANYDYDAPYKYPNGSSYYTGTLDTYQNAVNTDIINPLGFSNDFNSTTGSFISGMTGANRDNLTDYQQVLDSMKSNLTQSLGPDYLNLGVSEPTMIPPYAT